MGNPQTVLICDDDELLREFYGRVLKSLGFEYRIAANGDEAIEQIEAHGALFCLVVIDLMMPVRTGWEVIQWMKEHPVYKDIPVIAISGLANSFDACEQIRDNCAAVLNKGEFNLAQFAQLVRKHAVTP